MASSCPACESLEASVFAESPVDREYFLERAMQASIIRCGSCKSLYQDPMPTSDEVHGFYSSDYQNYTTTSVPLLSQIDHAYQRRQSASFISRHGRDAAVLDFGCGQGGFLRALSANGCTQLAGFDFVLYEELEEVEGVQFSDDIEAILRSGQRFDVIRMRHVIEHLTDLDGMMGALAELLRPGGQIVGETPNGAHYTTDLMGQYWGPLHYPYHTVLFSVEGLGYAADRWGLRLGETSGPFLPTAWALSMENMLKQGFGWRKRGRTALYTALMASCMPMAVMDKLISSHATANFDFVLAKPLR
jgi:SAM-dependent methyltransferase